MNIYPEPEGLTAMRRVLASYNFSRNRDIRFIPETIEEVLAYIDKLKDELDIPSSDGYYGPMK